jgi:regulator of protease activity HflC (stomatin/prohibitin superfamily)
LKFLLSLSLLAEKCAVNFQVALFDVANPNQQIQACVDDVLRSTIPTLDLDEAYSAKEQMVQSILLSVKTSMQPFGFNISNVLVTDLQVMQIK